MKFVVNIYCSFILILGCTLFINACSKSSTGQNSPTNNNPSMRADRIFVGEHILTLDDKYPDASALAIRNGKILWVGNRADIIEWQTDETVITELGEHALLPGFIDAHGHLSFAAKTINFANVASPPVGPVSTIKSMQNVLKQYIAQRSFTNEEWIIGMGYDDSLLEEKRHPNRDDLDAVILERPLALIHVSGHLVVLNSLALKKIGINAQSINPEGGVIRRRPSSTTPNGILEETAARSVQAHMFAPSKHPAQDLKKTLETYASYGITTVQDGASSLSAYQMYTALADKEPFKLDVVVYPLANDNNFELPDTLDVNTYVNRLKFGGVKLVLDGSPQGKTAYLTEPYLIPPTGKPSNYRGYPTLDQATVNARIKKYLSKNIQILAHANGDAAADMLVDALAKTEKKISLGDHRTVMIHAQTVREDQLDLIKMLSIIPSYFSAHSYYWGDWHRDSVLGKSRASRISPARTTLERDIPFTIHNDAPIVPPDIIRLIWATVNRQTRSGKTLGKAQRISALEAIKATTANAAYQYFEEDTKGTLTPGKLADLVILSDNPTRVDAQDIKKIRVLETISHGKVVYSHSSD
ncbi:MAG: amidohydrolase [Pseudomonadales bacterium]|nr:amidohydrolase [Pseudomonadales bacterium]